VSDNEAMSVPHETLLETSVLYKLRDAELDKLCGRSKIWTGLSSLFEIVAGVPPLTAPNAENEFRARRSALRRWRDWITPARTIWRTPAEARCAAFGQSTRDHYDAFRTVTNVLIESTSLAECESRIHDLSKRAKRVPTLDWFRGERQRLHDDFRRVLQQSVRLARAVTSEQVRATGETDSRRQAQIDRTVRVFQHTVGDSERFTLLAIAEQAGAWDGKLPERGAFEAVLEIERQVRKQYDGSVDPWIRAYSTYVTHRVVSGNAARDGDSLDLDQLTYLKPGAVDRSWRPMMMN
jgi:hypothetical protein